MPLLWLSIAFIAGALIAANFALPTSTWLIIAGGATILTIFSIIFKRLRDKHPISQVPRLPPSLTPPLPTALILVSLTLGAARFQASLPDTSYTGFIAHYNDTGTTMVVTGIVSGFPDVRDTYTNLRVKGEYLHPADSFTTTDVSGILLARVSNEDQFQYGDRIVLRGQLQTPPEHEEFSYKDYLAHQGIYSYMSYTRSGILERDQGNPFFRAIYHLKSRALETVYLLWPDPEASLFAGILLGIETGIPEPVQEDFKNTGTTHVIAISGFNITIVAGIFASFFGRIFNQRRGAIAAVIGIGIYTILVGADAAVVRAAIMGGLSLFARQVGRRQQGLNTLAFTAGLMTLHNPHVPWDVGFQLSFAATLGLVLYAEPFAEAFRSLASRFLPEASVDKLVGPVGEYVLFTFAAQLTTMPIMAYHFGKISLSAFLANPAILPVQAPIMTVGGLALILGVIWLPLGKITAPLAWPFVLFTIRAVEFFGKKRRGVVVLGDFDILLVILFYIVLLGLTLGCSRARSLIAALKPITAIILLWIFSILIWRQALHAPDGKLHLTLLDVGTGDAILIQSPEGRYILIDGGPSASLLSNGLGRRLPPFHRKLDWLIVASPAREQIDALPRILDRFPPAQVLWAGPDSPSRAADYLRATLIENQISVIPAQAGQSLDLGRGSSIRVLTSGSRGAILLLEWENFRAVFPLDASEEDYQSLRMGDQIGPVAALLLADNGYAPLNPKTWIDNLNPQLVLLSVSADNPKGLPDRETMDSLGGYSLLRTDQHGWIHISTDGQNMWVEIEGK